MSKVVVISGHPHLDQSNANTVILQQLEKQLNSVDVRRLDQLYPDYTIDVAQEQAALLAADVIVLQFPFYWYSVPGLLKHWLDEVFTYNFAYGSKGDKLKGKDFLLSFTIGGPKESYDPLGYNHFAVEQFMFPFQQIAYLSGMVYRSPVYSHSMVYIPGVYNTLDAVEGRAVQHANRLVARVNALIGSIENRIQKFIGEWFANFDQLPDDKSFFVAHLTESLRLTGPEGQFVGHEGFCQWYDILRATFKPGCKHHIEQIEVKQVEAGYQADIRVRLIADTFADSDLRSKSVNMLVNEVWQLDVADNDHVVIRDYRVHPVSHVG